LQSYHKMLSHGFHCPWPFLKLLNPEHVCFHFSKPEKCKTKDPPTVISDHYVTKLPNFQFSYPPNNTHFIKKYQTSGRYLVGVLTKLNKRRRRRCVLSKIVNQKHQQECQYPKRFQQD